MQTCHIWASVKTVLCRAFLLLQVLGLILDIVIALKAINIF